MRGSIVLAVLVLVGTVLHSLPAQCETETAMEAEGKEEEPFRWNRAGFFLGATSEDIGGFETILTLGAEYERRLPWWERRFGLKVLAEVFVHGREFEQIVVAFPLVLHVTKPWWVHVGPGLEVIKEPGEGHERVNALFRIGTGYEIDLGHEFDLTPEVNVDAVRKPPALVFGVTIGKKF